MQINVLMFDKMFTFYVFVFQVFFKSSVYPFSSLEYGLTTRCKQESHDTSPDQSEGEMQTYFRVTRKTRQAKNRVGDEHFVACHQTGKYSQQCAFVLAFFFYAFALFSMEISELYSKWCMGN